MKSSSVPGLRAFDLSRRSFLASLAAAPAFADSDRIPGMGDMLWDYTLEYIGLLDERRRDRLKSVDSPEKLAELRAEVRAAIAAAWGPLPAERTPLNARRVGVLDRGDFLIEKVVFESRPSFFVTANLYRPKDASGRLPAIVFPCGHSDNGKAAEAYQRFCILAARHGFVALIYDPVGQGERLQLWDAAKGASAAGPGTREHAALGRQCYLVGLNLMNYRAWDSSRAIDYLLERDDVDPARIAMAGNSGGGMETLQYAATDDRVAAAFPSCAVASFRAKTEALLIADPEQILQGVLRAGVEHAELLGVLAPKPLIIGSAIRDFVPIDAARETYRDVARLYAVAGAADHVAMAETDAGHGLNAELRAAGVDWLLRWLSETSHDVTDDDSAPLASEDELRCTETGQVTTALASRTVSDLNIERARRIAPVRDVPRAEDFANFRIEIQKLVQEITRVGAFKPERGIVVPDRVIDAGPFARGVAVVIADRGKDDARVRRDVIDPIVSGGFSVLSLDLRGWGESKPAPEGLHAKFDWDDFFAYRGLEIGRPLLGQRMKDVLAIGPTRTHRRRWMLVGVGGGAPVAAHAALLDPRVDSLIVIGGPLSYRWLAEDPLATQPASCYLPGVVGAYDLREVYAAGAPRPTLVLNPEDPRRRPAHEVRAWEELDWTARVYEGLGATGRFQVRSGLDGAAQRKALTEWVAGFRPGS